MKTIRSQTTVLTLLPLLLISTPMKLKAQSTNAPLLSKTMKWDVSQRGEMQYLVYLPKEYDAKSSKRWPLMLFLHGAGERGTNLQRVAIHGPPSLVKQGKSFPFIIVAPQCANDERWQNDSLVKLLDHVMVENKVDGGRVYLTGLSMGGYGTWKLALAYPEKFAAIAPICGGGEYIDALLASRAKAAALKSLPVWAFHGAKDNVVPLEESERMVDALKKIGVKDVKLTVYPEADHNSWSETYNNPEFYEWLLKHERKP
jgi:predicted peptidase